MKMWNRGVLAILLLLFVVSSCYVQRTPEVREAPSYKYDFSSLYNPSETSLHPKVRIYSENDSQALVFFRLSSDEIRANQRNSYDTSFNLVVKYALRDVSTFEIVDSGVNRFKISTDFSSKYIDLYFQIKLKPETKNKLIIGFSGPKSGTGARIILDLDNSDEFVSERFIPEHKEDGFNVLYDNFVHAGETYRIRSKLFESLDCKIEYYEFDDYIVLPPYYIANHTEELNLPDSVFTYRIGDAICLEEEGYYVFKPSSQKPASFCLLNAGDLYPNIAKLSDMHEPLKLVATVKELKTIAESEVLKDAIDEFWLQKSNNKKFAREQIRVFYNRVELANNYFSDYREGWKTDRGNLYVVLGPPTIVNMSSQGEEWFYGENPDVAGVLFIFEKKQSVTGNIVYSLRRDAMYQTLWSQAIATWRNGRIFTITKN